MPNSNASKGKNEIEIASILEDDLEEAVEDYSKLQLIANFLCRNIVLYSMDNPDNCQHFEPEDKKVSEDETKLELVRDDSN